jgi:hypothetical protein
MCKICKTCIPEESFGAPVPEVAVFWLQDKDEMRARFTGRSSSGTRMVYRYTEDLPTAKAWIDARPSQHTVRLVQGWRLPDGKLTLTDPAKAGIYAVEPYRWSGPAKD